VSPQRLYLAGSRRWYTDLDAAENGRPLVREQFNVQTMAGLGGALVAWFALKASDDPVGAGLAFVDGPLDSEDTNGAMLLVDVSGRVELVSIADGLPASPGFQKALVPRTVEIAGGSVNPLLVRPNVVTWLRLGRPEPNLWRGEVSADGIAWSTIGDLTLALEPTSCAAFLIEWPYAGSWSEAYVRGLDAVTP